MTCGKGRLSTQSGAITTISSMCCVMCMAALVSAHSSSGPSRANAARTMPTWKVASSGQRGRLAPGAQQIDAPESREHRGGEQRRQLFLEIASRQGTVRKRRPCSTEQEGGRDDRPCHGAG
jgi:hypothetical protein